MRRGLLLGIVLALWAAPTAAQEGVYQSETREVGSQLILAPDGRFLWQFAYGALDMSGSGTWAQAADGAVVLTSDAGIVAPRFELIGRSRDDAPGVAIRLACDTGDMRVFLNVMVQHGSGEGVPYRFNELAIRTDDDPRGAVTGVRLFSESFNLVSEEYAVNPQEANVLTFRFHPNDLGRADFRAERAVIADGVLTLSLNGMPIRYRRQGSAAGQALPPLPPVARSRADAAPVPLAVSFYEVAGELRNRAAGALVPIPGDEMMIASGPVELRLSHEGHSIDLGRIESGRQPLIISTGSGEGGEAYVAGISFNNQDAPLALDAALARAQALKAWLERAGFVVMPGADTLDRAPFAIDTEDGFAVAASDWAGAAAVLADEARAISEMNLYLLRTNDLRAMVRLENVRRIERDQCAHSDWPNGGRDWRLAVDISHSLAPAAE